MCVWSETKDNSTN